VSVSSAGVPQAVGHEIENASATKFAVNYCPEIAGLRQARRVSFDLVKCPAWPELVAAVLEESPAYVHLPLAVGWGIGGALDMETGEPADWDALESLLVATATPLVNLHLAPPHVLCTGNGDSGSTIRSTVPALDRLAADVAGVVACVGARRVALENDYESTRSSLNPGLLADTFQRVLGETGAGLLLDLAHARLAARRLGVGVRDYVESLPVSRLRELHVSGVQRLSPGWARVLQRGGVTCAEIDGFLERTIDGMCDHLPMTPADWELTQWALGRIECGAWARPWVVSLEYGGVGRWFGPVTNERILARDLPRLADMVASL
jgi:uncharacterized protein (UPF0276 family)